MHSSITSALVLPWVHEDTWVELSVHKGDVGVLSLEIRLVHSLSELPSFHENIIAMEVLIRRLREIILIKPSRILADLILNHSIVKFIGCATIGSKIITNQILRSLRTISKTSFLEIIILVRSITLTKNLRLRAEILFWILREIINGSLLFMKCA